MKRDLRSRLVREDGIAMVLVVIISAFMSLLAVTLIDVVRAESDRSARSVWSEGSFQAAEAGLDDYIAKLVDDRAYYLHYVHSAESTRRPPAGADVVAGSAWSYSLAWTYPNGKDTWKQLTNGYEYDLQITPPSPGTEDVRVIATGRKIGSTTDVRAIETLVRPSSIADFQMLANNDITYGSAATTSGKIYAGIDTAGVRHNVTHNGVARANIYAEGSVGGPPTLQNGAQTYNSSNIRTVIKNPINFQSFLASLVDIQRAATLSARYFDNPAIHAWRLTFLAAGSVDVQQCLRVGTNDVAAVQPTCGAATNYSVPSNGAMYFAQTVIVQGLVKGRVTVASNDNLVIGARDYPGERILSVLL